MYKNVPFFKKLNSLCEVAFFSTSYTPEVVIFLSEHWEIEVMHKLVGTKYNIQDLSRTMIHAQAPTKALTWKMV